MKINLWAFYWRRRLLDVLQDGKDMQLRCMGKQEYEVANILDEVLTKKELILWLSSSCFRGLLLLPWQSMLLDQLEFSRIGINMFVIKLNSGYFVGKRSTLNCYYVSGIKNATKYISRDQAEHFARDIYEIESFSIELV